MRDDGPYLLRINRPRVQTPDTIGSEMAWLSALRRDTDLGVPEPVAARDGSFVVLAGDPGVPKPLWVPRTPFSSFPRVRRGHFMFHARARISGRAQFGKSVWARRARG
jgi:hypothetical protein